MALGIQLLHPTLRNELYVVENPGRPFGDGGYDCNLCVGVHHYGKTTHLWLGPGGDCLVSEGVLEELRRAGMPNLQVIGSTATPPPLTIGRGSARHIQENTNRKIHVFADLRRLLKVGDTDG
jgi:hypothetical protein